MVPFFHKEKGILYAGSDLEAWKLLGVNALGATVIILWTVLWSLLLFKLLNYFKILRIEGYDEFYGMDLTQHGESAYPASAWVEEQYNAGGTNQPVLPRLMSQRKKDNNSPANN